MASSPDTTLIAFALIRIFEGRVAIDDLSGDAGFDTRFTSTCHSIRAGGSSFVAAELGVWG